MKEIILVVGSLAKKPWSGLYSAGNNITPLSGVADVGIVASSTVSATVPSITMKSAKEIF